MSLYSSTHCLMKVSGMMTSDGVANSLIIGTTGAITVAVLIPFANNFKDPHPLLTLGDTLSVNPYVSLSL